MKEDTHRKISGMTSCKAIPAAKGTARRINGASSNSPRLIKYERRRCGVRHGYRSYFAAVFCGFSGMFFWQIAACFYIAFICAMVASGFSEENTLCPHTRISAPASIVRRAVSRLIPPSTSMRVWAFLRRIHLFEPGNLFDGLGYEFLSAESRIYRHDKYHVSIGDNVFEHGDGCMRIEGDSGFHARFFDFLHRAVQMQTSLVMYVHHVCTEGLQSGNEFLGLGDHEVYIERFPAQGSYGFDDRKSERDVRDEHPVHDIEVQQSALLWFIISMSDCKSAKFADNKEGR